MFYLLFCVDLLFKTLLNIVGQQWTLQDNFSKNFQDDRIRRCSNLPHQTMLSYRRKSEWLMILNLKCSNLITDARYSQHQVRLCKTVKCVAMIYRGIPIDLVLIDQQSGGKISLHLMCTSNAKKIIMDDTLLACQQIFGREPRSDPLSIIFENYWHK
jgi:hypothetical protein